MVRSLQRVGFLSSTDYMEGEAEKPGIFDLAAQVVKGRTTGG